MKQSFVILCIVLSCLAIFGGINLARYAVYRYPIDINTYDIINSSRAIGQPKEILDAISNGMITEAALALFPSRIAGAFIFPVIIGIIDVILIYLIMRKLKPDLSLYVILIVITSPLFLDFSVHINQAEILLMLFLLGIYALLNDLYAGAVLSFILIIFADLKLILLPILAFVLYYRKYGLIGNAVGTIILSVSFMIIQAFSKTIDPATIFHGISSLNFISDFTGKPGLGVFTLILGIIGLLLSWKNKKGYMLIYLGVAFVSLLSINDIGMMIYLDIFTAFFASLALSKLIDMNWEIRSLKFYAILLIVCGLAFSSISYSKILFESDPGLAEVDCLESIGLTPVKADILTQKDYIAMVNEISGKDTKTGLDSIIGTNTQLYQNMDLELLKEYLNENNIGFIYLNEEIKETFWPEDESGLLFLLENSKSFSKVCDSDGVEAFMLLN